MPLNSIPNLIYSIKTGPRTDRRTSIFRSVADSIARDLQRLTIQDSPQPATEDTESEEEDDINLDPNDARLVKFARFVNGGLKMFTAKTDELEYVDFSHVWGDSPQSQTTRNSQESCQVDIM